MTVDGKSLSIVIQGQVTRPSSAPAHQQVTRRNIENIRRILPAAEVVLSTWKGADTEGLSPDLLVLSEDPGAWVRGCGRTNNVNRQIVSSREGLRASTRRYAVKMRTDCELIHDGFLSLLAQEGPLCSDLRLFQQRIVGCQFFFRDPWKSSMLFHIGDIFQSGLRDDLLDLWDIPLSPGDQGHSLADALRRASPPALVFSVRNFSHYEEQYIWLSLLAKKGVPATLVYPFDATADLVRRSELSIANNFVIAGPEQLGLVLMSRVMRLGDPYSTYTPEDWKVLSKIYCAGNEAAIARRISTVMRRHFAQEWRWLGQRMLHPGRILRFARNQINGTRSLAHVADFDEEWSHLL